MLLSYITSCAKQLYNANEVEVIQVATLLISEMPSITDKQGCNLDHLHFIGLVRPC